MSFLWRRFRPRLLLAVFLGFYLGAAEGLEKKVVHFVEEFYQWYTPVFRKGGWWNTAIQKKSTCFDVSLLKALKEDALAQDRNPGEIVGLDFDPFLNAQDIVKSYRVGKAEKKGDNYHVSVFAGGKQKRPQIIVEVSFRQGQCFFVNFHYPEMGNLRTLLKEMAEDRKKPRP